MKVAQNPQTGLFFDGFGFNTATVAHAKRFPNGIETADFAVFWDCPVELLSEYDFWGPCTMLKFAGIDKARPAEAGLFWYSGFGWGNYYSATGKVMWLDWSKARKQARKEGVEFAYDDPLKYCL